MLSTPSWSNLCHACRICSIVVCCGCSCTPTLNRAIPQLSRLGAVARLLDAEDFDLVLLDADLDGWERRQGSARVGAGGGSTLLRRGAVARTLGLRAHLASV